MGRTCVEATPDVTARPIGRTVHALLRRCEGIGVVDLFAGSANLMFHVAPALSAPARGLDADEAVWAQTDANLHRIGASISVRLGGWLSYFDGPLRADTAVYVLSPPWGDGFSFANGLDLARTAPPIPVIVDTIAARDRSTRCGDVRGEDRTNGHGSRFRQRPVLTRGDRPRGPLSRRFSTLRRQGHRPGRPVAGPPDPSLHRGGRTRRSARTWPRQPAGRHWPQLFIHDG